VKWLSWYKSRDSKQTHTRCWRARVYIAVAKEPGPMITSINECKVNVVDFEVPITKVG
jgi:hypothetical protein